MPDSTSMGSAAVLRERRCKGIRKARSEMAGIAPEDIVNKRAIQRHRVDFISRRNNGGLNVLGEAIYIPGE